MKKLILPLVSVALVAMSSYSYANTKPVGVYSGEFADGKATLFIDSVNNGKVSGTSLYKHNKRPITGTMTARGSFWQIILNEPGTRTGDGQFEIMANKDNPNTLIGTWKVYPKTNTSAGLSTKSFNLQKSECKYRKYFGTFNEASMRALTDEELFRDPDTLDYMRNEIYARHGYSFKSDKWISVYADLDWYTPCYTNVDNKLTEIEQQNIKSINKMRAYMVANPSQWGR